jgi:acetyl-CoA decarbonylase/synthase, CODH/ACS complex subunit gamma
MILCAMNPQVMEAGLMAAPKARPLLYAATTKTGKTWQNSHSCTMPTRRICTKRPNELGFTGKDPKQLRRKDIVLDPGTFANEGLADTLNNFTMLRRAATKAAKNSQVYHLLGVPMVAWADKGETADDLIKWREAYIAGMLVVRYADILSCTATTDGALLLKLAVLRQNIYTDPRKPVAVAPGLKVFGTPDENSQCMFTSNFALTYYTVASDIESSKPTPT